MYMSPMRYLYVPYALFMESGKYEPLQSVATISNAMDVGNPSNFIFLQVNFLESTCLVRGLRL